MVTEAEGLRALERRVPRPGLLALGQRGGSHQPIPAASGLWQVPPLLPDGWLLEHHKAGRLLHHPIRRDPGRLGLPLQAEGPFPQPEGWVPSGSGSLTPGGERGGCPGQIWGARR